jgi:hypothetical protein
VTTGNSSKWSSRETREVRNLSETINRARKTSHKVIWDTINKNKIINFFVLNQ